MLNVASGSLPLPRRFARYARSSTCGERDHLSHVVGDPGVVLLGMSRQIAPQTRSKALRRTKRVLDARQGMEGAKNAYRGSQEVKRADINGKFGALGHGISDSDTGELVETSGGNLYDTQILGIEKGKIGTPGMLSGVIYYGPKSEIGTVTENTDYGIFGTVSQTFLKEHRTDRKSVV